MPYRFEWDNRRVATDIRKHGVSFDEASTVFDDPLTVISVNAILRALIKTMPTTPARPARRSLAKSARQPALC